MTHTARLLYTAIMLLALAACSDNKAGDDEEAPRQSAEELYQKARDEFVGRQFKTAVKSFEEVERQHPSSEWAINAQIMSGYASYRADDYDTAVATLERFVKLYPNHESTPYAYYMIAICYYEQIADVGRDQKVTEQAMQALREVIRRFPDSEYARDAKIKLDLTQDHLAGKEMQVGRYYESHDQYLAAINRFRFVVENFQTTSHVPEALHRLVECYLRLGVVDEATRYAAVLGYNFPNSIWYRDSYALLNGGAKPIEWDEDNEKADESLPEGDTQGQLKEPPASLTDDGIIRRDAEPAPVEPVVDMTTPEETKPEETKPEGQAEEHKEGKEDDSSFWDSVLPW